MNICKHPGKSFPVYVINFYTTKSCFAAHIFSMYDKGGAGTIRVIFHQIYVNINETCSISSYRACMDLASILVYMI